MSARMTTAQRTLLERAVGTGGGLNLNRKSEYRSADILCDRGFLRAAIYYHHQFYITDEGRAALASAQSSSREEETKS